MNVEFADEPHSETEPTRLQVCTQEIFILKRQKQKEYQTVLINSMFKLNNCFNKFLFHLFKLTLLSVYSGILFGWIMMCGGGNIFSFKVSQVN